ncbi:hypothetical protein [Paenibacillus donghaensis]|uniref:Uncharacterized protein n=1 Tax=Paenibacillus donghaensis TaxID=414771 RepID=A0A2Z2K888_9BACL|nr:hypothetical protein [Paenibacillus donghaensis]ASA19445.1 hypothetical protein B9T62_00390 [Paenibacillus donghaensis]
MLELDSPVWSRLHGPFGSAGPVPELLKQLGHSYIAEVKDELYWEHLFHQNTLYPATYAAFPYLAEIACRTADLEVKLDIYSGLRNRVISRWLPIRRTRYSAAGKGYGRLYLRFPVWPKPSRWRSTGCGGIQLQSESTCIWSSCPIYPGAPVALPAGSSWRFGRSWSARSGKSRECEHKNIA